MVVFDPRGHVGATIKLERFARLPSAVEDAHVDVRVVDVFAGLPRVPREHIAGRADRPFGIEDRDQRLSIFKMDCLFQVFRDAAHVQRNYDSSAQTVLIEKRRNNLQFIALDVLLDQADYLGEQILPASLPCGFHLLVKIARG